MIHQKKVPAIGIMIQGVTTRSFTLVAVPPVQNYALRASRAIVTLITVRITTPSFDRRVVVYRDPINTPPQASALEIMPALLFASSDLASSDLARDSAWDDDVVHLQSRAFGSYTVPSRLVRNITARQVVVHIASLSENSPLNAFFSDSDSLSQLKALLPPLLCRDVLLADIPAILPTPFVALLVRCWTYLIWMLLLQEDASVITPQARDEALWQLVLYCEGRHGAPTDILNVRQKNFKTKVKKALRFTAMLLVDSELLHRFVAIDGVVSPSAIYTLDDHRLTADSMWALVRAVDARGHGGDEPHDGQPQQRRVTRSNIGALLVAAEVSSQRAVGEEKNSLATEDVSSTEELAKADCDEDEEGNTDDEENKDEEQLVDATVLTVASQMAKPKNRKKKRRKSVPERPATPKRTKTTIPSTQEVASMTTTMKDLTLVIPPPKSCMPPSAIDRLSAVEFRHPDLRIGCFVDDDVHDLFCEHHMAWRRAVLSELRALSPAALQEMQSTASDAHGSAYTSELLRRWGHRLQVVWPVDIDETATHDALAHLSLELPQHDHGALFHSHSALADTTEIPPSHWIFASDHARDSEEHGNSAHLQALCRIFLGPKHAWASFDDAAGIPAEDVPIDLLLRLGCMLVVVMQSEGSVVLVPSASAGESAHLVRGTAEAAPIAGNFLTARHVCSVIDRQRREGPADTVKLEWAQEWAAQKDAEACSKAGTATAPFLALPVATEMIHTFLAEVDKDDPRYRPDYRSQSFIPELCLTGQALRILDESVRELPIPLEHMADLWKLGPAQDLVTATLSVKSLSVATPRWYKCCPVFGCTRYLQILQDAPFQLVRSIRRPPLLVRISSMLAAQHPERVLGAHIMAGHLLRHCASSSSVLQRPAILFDGAFHNQPHRVGAWCFLPHRQTQAALLNNDAGTPPREASSYNVEELLETLYNFMRKNTRLSAGNEHMIEGVLGRTRSANGHKLPDIGEQYADTVSIAAGDITRASATRLIQALELDDTSRFLDIGSSTGCLCMHVALSTCAVRVTGIEVLKPRSELAQQLYRDVIAQSSSMASALGRRVQHATGDIMGNLSLLFEHTHVFMFDKCFAPVTRAVLAHAVSYLSDDGGGAVRTIASCHDLREHNQDLLRVGEPISLALTGGTESFQSYVFSVDQKRKNMHAVEVFRSPVHGLGLRTTRAVMEGQRLCAVTGEVMEYAALRAKKPVSKKMLYPYLLPAATDRSCVLHVVNVARFLNSSAGTGRLANVCILPGTPKDTPWIIAIRPIPMNEELLVDYPVYDWCTNGIELVEAQGTLKPAS